MKFVRDNGLTIVLVAATIGTLVGMTVSGLSVYNEELAEHRLPATTFASYVASGHFLSALFENWESEFLQMSAYVVLTAFLFQRGSAESKDPDQIKEHDLKPADQIGRPGTPKSVRAGGLGRTLYAYSLGIALFTLFLLSFALHLLESARAATLDAQRHARLSPLSSVRPAMNCSRPRGDVRSGTPLSVESASSWAGLTPPDASERAGADVSVITSSLDAIGVFSSRVLPINAQVLGLLQPGRRTYGLGRAGKSRP